jgi:hypothetical protein
MQAEILFLSFILGRQMRVQRAKHDPGSSSQEMRRAESTDSWIKGKNKIPTEPFCNKTSQQVELH